MKSNKKLKKVNYMDFVKKSNKFDWWGEMEGYKQSILKGKTKIEETKEDEFGFWACKNCFSTDLELVNGKRLFYHQYAILPWKCLGCQCDKGFHWIRDRNTTFFDEKIQKDLSMMERRIIKDEKEKMRFYFFLTPPIHQFNDKRNL